MKTVYRDIGCKLAPSCLDCPLNECVNVSSGKTVGERRISKSGKHYINYYIKTGKPHTGRPKGSYAPEVNYNRNSKACLERDNYLCQFCGSNNNLKAHHKDNEGHHIKNYKTDDDLRNLITVCSRCHQKLHYGVMEKHADILRRRENGETLQSIADSYGVSRQRIFGIIKASIYKGVLTKVSKCGIVLPKVRNG